ncbi:MAG: methylenetetrahydrofolate reductase [Candidatus Latescibacterota bacterium]
MIAEQAQATTPGSVLQHRLEGGRPVLLAEIAPPRGADPAPLRRAARQLAGRVHAVGISDNRERVAMSALAAAALVAAEGVEPVLHVTTRDRNRIALVSLALGAQALGIRNLLCTSGTHQTLGLFRTARNVYDIDAVQLLQTCARLAEDAELVGEEGLAGVTPFCLGAVAAPCADPPELQLMRIEKKVAAGAGFLVTQPVFDLERFGAWWQAISRRGIPEKVAVIAGIQPLTGAALERVRAGQRPLARVPEAVLQRLAGLAGAAQRAAALEHAAQTIGQLSGLAGLGGFSLCADGDPDTALAVIEKAGLGSD